MSANVLSNKPNKPDDSKAQKHSNSPIVLFKYPYGTVIFIYTFLGGAVGGLVFCMGVFIYYVFDWLCSPYFRPDINVLFNSLMGLLMFIVFAAMFGFPSAFISGVILAFNKTVVASKADYLKIGLIGTSCASISVLLYGLLPYMADDDFHIIELLPTAFVFGVIGGLSAIIVASFVLPKTKLKRSQP